MPRWRWAGRAEGWRRLGRRRRRNLRRATRRLWAGHAGRQWARRLEGRSRRRGWGWWGGRRPRRCGRNGWSRRRRNRRRSGRRGKGVRAAARARIWAEGQLGARRSGVEHAAGEDAASLLARPRVYGWREQQEQPKTGHLAQPSQQAGSQERRLESTFVVVQGFVFCLYLLPKDYTHCR